MRPALERRHHQRLHALPGNHRAGLPRQPGYPRRLPDALPRARRHTTAHTGGAHAPPDHLWMLRRLEDLDADEQLQLKQVLASSPHLDATATHVATFAEMLTGRHGDRLNSCIAAVDAEDLPHLHRFGTGLRRDYEAVRNGLTLSHSSGTVEGHVNRIKMIKRQMYGRPKFDLLRKRILLAA